MKDADRIVRETEIQFAKAAEKARKTPGREATVYSRADRELMQAEAERLRGYATELEAEGFGYE